MKRREANIEVYRVALMFGICLLHTIGFGGYVTRWMQGVLLSCVVGFVFISGWFGVKFSWWKLVKLYGIGLYCAFVVAILLVVFGSCEMVLQRVGVVALRYLKTNWFLHAYAVMMILAPFINAVTKDLPILTKDTWKQYLALLPFLAMVWIWGFGRTLPYGTQILPKTDGLDAYGGITLLGIYAATRAVKASGIVEKIKWWHLVVAIPVLWIATGIGLGDYNSPFAFGLAFAIFLVFKRISVHRIVGSIAVWLGPSMFSVYLIHTNEFGFGWIKKLSHYFVGNCGVNIIVAYLLIAIIVFCSAFLLDLPRRFVILITKLPCNWLTNRLKYE